MARTNPHHDWNDPASPRSPAPSNTSSEWDSLRNELVALLDQVEDRLLADPPRPDTDMALPQPREAATNPVPRSVTEPDPSAAPKERQSEALLSVKRAVERLAERSETPAPEMRRDAVARAIGQIRARQGATGGPAGGRPAPTATPAPTPGPSDEIAGLALSLERLGTRIERFEAAVAARLDTFDGHGEIPGQIAQLSEVIELLASAVGESGQVKRLENQIEHLAHAVIQSERREDDGAAGRIEELAATVEKLVTLQLQNADRDQDMARASEAREADAMRRIEESVRSVYDRLDALEAAGTAPSPEIETISRDIAALTATLKDRDDPSLLVERIDNLSDKISALEAAPARQASSLEDSIATLRTAVEEVVEPRFSTIETRLDDLGARLDGTDAGGAAVDMSGVEDQLRHLATRMDETGQQVRDLATLYDTAPGQAQPVEHLVGVKRGIAQVDSRLARLESMINDGRASAPADPPAPTESGLGEPTAEQALSPRRKPRPDHMPEDPATGMPGEETAIPDSRTDERTEPEFRVDPEAIERPSKPRSSLSDADDTQRLDEPAPASATADGSADIGQTAATASRSSFIEAARRSARQHAPEPDDTPKSLIGRAMARFHKTEGEQLKASGSAAEAAPREDDTHIDPFLDESKANPDEKKKPGFLARNKRPLLLGTALVVVMALGAQLLLSRTTATAPDPAPAVEAEATSDAPAQADPETGAPAADEPEASSTASDQADSADLMSGVRMIEQQAALATGPLDRATILAADPIDPVQTAAIGSEPHRYISRTTSEPALDVTATLPAIIVPEAIEPAELRDAAENGDMFAQFEVGAILTEGHAIEQDLGQAAAWYERAAAQGFAPAQYRLGSLYEGGRGVERDLDMARLWYQRAAEAGNRMSMHNLASLHASGELDEQDFAAAAHWFEEAAARGLTDSQFNLGMLFARGLGVEQDFEQSYIWFSLAAQSGDEDAVAAREDVVRSLDADAVQRLNEIVASWSPAEIDLANNFAPIGTWNEQFDPGQAIGNREVVLRVQVLLGKLGFDVGQPDGIVGPMTRDAISAFERETGMSESGEVNPRLLAVLGSQPV